MTSADPVASLPAKPRYRRGLESRERILLVALQAFGERGFQAVSTREIASAAHVNLPAIQYYFGSKEGLYKACAEHIVARYMTANLPVSAAALEAVLKRASPGTCQTHLLNVLTTLGRFLVDSDEARGWPLFIQRELADPGPAFDILFDQLWHPGVELVAKLIDGARGDTPGSEGSRLEAIHMISGITAFTSGRAAIDRLLTDPQSPVAIADQLCRLIERQVALVAVQAPSAPDGGHDVVQRDGVAVKT
ncbi:CerR family C-terminal domain-containing protein [Sphingosinicellaceae bacterium]|nr:CerR family C-terminal domain-containing protein [Sphingosinicellaceae bacterium]